MWNKIVEMFNSLFNGKFSAIIKAVFSKSRSEAVAAIWEIALDSVVILSQSELSNAEKRKQAFKEIKEAAKAKGKEVADSVINLAIEMAVATMKG